MVQAKHHWDPGYIICLTGLEIIERRLRGEAALRVWREYRKLTQERTFFMEPVPFRMWLCVVVTRLTM